MKKLVDSAPANISSEFALIRTDSRTNQQIYSLSHYSNYYSPNESSYYSRSSFQFKYKNISKYESVHPEYCYLNCESIEVNKASRKNIIIFLAILLLNIFIIEIESVVVNDYLSLKTIQSDENFTFANNGSFIQIDAGREWPFNSKREITFRFKTKSPHGLLIYQTFDHNKLTREEEQENSDPTPVSGTAVDASDPRDKSSGQSSHQSNVRHQLDSVEVSLGDKNNRETRATPSELDNQVKHLNRPSRDNLSPKTEQLSQFITNAITATASKKLVNSLFLSSPAAAINGNQSPLSSQPISRDTNVFDSLSKSSVGNPNDSPTSTRGHRVLTGLALAADGQTNRIGYDTRVPESSDGRTVLSSSTISSFSASLYELYLKLENGRLKIMYEFGSRLNQTYCGKGLNDDRWHKVELRVDPELNQMILILDQVITVEIVLSQLQHEDESVRRNELVFTNSILYIGGLNNNASMVKNMKQRLYMAQFIGCIGQILFKTDQHTESTLQPVGIDNLVLVRRGCLNRCDTDNYCLHKSTCINYYSHTKCDCFGTNYEDTYCWQDQLTSLTMLGYSTLSYRIYDWRDRHHSSVNRFSLQFRTLAPNSILFFAYGDLSAQNIRNPPNVIQTYPIQPLGPLNTISQTNISTMLNVQRPSTTQSQSNSNYLAISLSNGSIVVEVSFGDQPILLSSLLSDKIIKRSIQNNRTEKLQPSVQNSDLADNKWHNLTFIHNNRQLFLYLDDFGVNYTTTGKNYHLYFDPSIYVGGVPNLLLNETRTLTRPLNLRHKFVGCLKSVYFNQHNVLLSLKQGSPMAEYKDVLGKAKFGACHVQEPSSLPLTMRSGKSYLTFQLSPNILGSSSSNAKSSKLTMPSIDNQSKLPVVNPAVKKLTKIEFEYKTSLKTHFLAGGLLRDSNYHDLGGFWTLHAKEDCRLCFSISSGLTYEPEQIIELETNRCEPDLWNRVSISIISGDKILNVTQYPIEVDNEGGPSDLTKITQRSYNLKSSIELLHQVQLGGDLAKFGESSSVPFSGCIRRIMINDHLFDSRDFVSNLAKIPSTSNLNSINTSLIQQGSDYVSSQIAQGYVTLDSCSLVNPCIEYNPCKNNGICKLNDLGEPDCDCSKTGYTGKRCHFSIYKQSCYDLFLSGYRKSSYYLIDLDRNGPLKPIRVRCNMDSTMDKIQTILNHNLPPEYLVRRTNTNDVHIYITYMVFHHLYTSDGFYNHDEDDTSLRTEQDTILKNLISQSNYCKQYLRFECKSSPLHIGNKTWMIAPYPKRHKIISLDSTNQGSCTCAISQKKCLDPTKTCNCDSGESIWTDDSYEFSNRENVGLTKIVFLRYDPEGISDRVASNLGSVNIGSQTRLTLGDLKCYGAKEQEQEHEITFKTSDAYIEVPGWRKGDIAFSFRTASNPPAIILYQLATSRNHGYFRLTLISDVRMQFEFIVNRKPRKLFLSSTHKLNNGEWQQVFIEYDSMNLRLSINDESLMVDLDTNDFLGTFEGPLFIGGAPSKYLVGDLSKRNGFTGCFRGLRIDRRSIDLKSYLSPSMPTVISGCQPSCTKNLCQNGGKCIEYWGSYECECSNPIAHSGNNCEINLNTNSITFVTQEAYYVQTLNDSLAYSPYLIKNILLNIRTYQETALIFYSSDSFNNFIQLHKNGSSLVLTFNSNSTIIKAQVPIHDDSSIDLALTGNSEANQSPMGLTGRSEIPVQSFTKSSQTPSVTGMNSGPITNQTSPDATWVVDKSIRVSNTSGSGFPIQVKIERTRLRTTFYVNDNFLVIEKPMILLNNYTQSPWVNSELELVRPIRPKWGSKFVSRMFLANVDENFITRLPGFTGCIQGLSIDNQLLDFNRAHLTGTFKDAYRIGCKMHCDSLPCKNKGTCIENWLEDKIQCKCEGTSYTGDMCDEDVAANFNGYSSYFHYQLPDKIKNSAKQYIFPESLKSNSSSGIMLSDEPNRPNVDPIVIIDNLNYFDVSVAFSTDVSSMTIRGHTSIQVIVLITKAKSSKYFLLGLTSEGSLLIQEDFGSSMSLSRLIKRQDYPYYDGHRHMVKYSRYNKTIHITVDQHFYLATMSVIGSNQFHKFSKYSLILVGSAPTRLTHNTTIDSGYSNYTGCVSSLVVKMDSMTFEPIGEAFGQNFENISKSTSDLNGTVSDDVPKKSKESSRLQLDLLKSSILKGSEVGVHENSKFRNDDQLNSVERILVRDVEQGGCAPFRKVEVYNENKSVNEPKNTSLVEPRPVYTDPPRVHLIIRSHLGLQSREFYIQRWLFYGSLFILASVGSLCLIYVYILQMRYKSEKFRFETPFFHRRDSSNESNSSES